jgi:hypothetical protein
MRFEEAEAEATEHKVQLLYLEYHSVCPLVRFRNPPPPPPPEPKGGGHTRLRVRGGGVPIRTIGEKA